MSRLFARRAPQVAFDASSMLIVVDPKLGARLVRAKVMVWEIVREVRCSCSLDAFRKAYPTLTDLEIDAALHYANTHIDETERQIAAYEAVQARRQAEYPFAA